MIWLTNNWRHGPTDEAMGVGGGFVFFQLVRALVVEQAVLPSYKEHDALNMWYYCCRQFGVAVVRDVTLWGSDCSNKTW
jgi:hypothetical protein